MTSKYEWLDKGTYCYEWIETYIESVSWKCWHTFFITKCRKICTQNTDSIHFWNLLEIKSIVVKINYNLVRFYKTVKCTDTVRFRILNLNSKIVFPLFILSCKCLHKKKNILRAKLSVVKNTGRPSTTEFLNVNIRKTLKTW